MTTFLIIIGILIVVFIVINLINLKPKKNEHRDIVYIMDKEAIIETWYEEGIVGGFLILLKGEQNSIICKLKNTETKSAFIDIIEERIKNRDYKNDIPKILDDFIPNSNKVKVASNAKRAVLTINYEPIFGW